MEFLSKCELDSKNCLVWADMEMTGLDVDKDKILEIACIITDSDLNAISKPINLTIHQPDDVLNSMDEWCTKVHNETGLVQECRESNISLEDAEKKLLDYTKGHIPKRTCPLAGNSVYVDRTFLIKYMPTFNDYLHYRIVDVSTIKEVCKRWNPVAYKNAPAKKVIHRALDDILESIEELRYYKKLMFLSK